MERGRRGALSTRLGSCAVFVAVSALAGVAGAEPKAPAGAEAVRALERRSLSLPSATEIGLDNGLRVLFHEARSQPQVALVVAYEIGSRDDPVGYGELAHLVEHMTYRGSSHLPALGGLDLLERLGASIQNGVTHPDFTAYYALVPSSALAHALWVESERMAFTLERFDEKSLELERDIVRNEILLRTGHDRLLEHHARRAIFGHGHPYTGPAFPGRDLDAIDLSHVQWFFQQSYRPNNARLILVGDFETRRARELVERYFGSVRNPEVALRRRHATTRSFFQSRVLTLETLGFRRATTVFWPAATGTPREAAAADLFVRVLRARIRSRLVDERGLAGHVAFRVEKRDYASFFALTIDLRPSIEPADVEREIDSLFREADQSSWDDELDAVRREALLDELLGLENLVDRAMRHLEALRRTGRPFLVSRRIADLRGVTPDDLRRHARSFVMSQRVVARLERANPHRPVPPWGRLKGQ